MPQKAFELISETELSEYHSTGRLYRHAKTGLEVFHIVNDDPENLFAFAFRTIPTDSTGVAHILEHSVLCGSRRYPLKDSFITVSQGSLNTYMNAWTFPDRTVYPAASLVEADYFNLMGVYADSVFFPLLKPEVFLQEGHRLVPLGDGRAEIQGVVYSEMLGNYSSPEGILDNRAFRALFDPGHPYAYDSGGDPEDIPSLSYEAFMAFHSSHYHPSNCRVFLYGNIDSEKQLEFLDREFLCRFQASEPAQAVRMQKPFDAPRRLEVPFPADSGGGKTSLLVSWLYADASDPVASLSMEILGEVLLGHDGSPLGRALRESGLGEDLAPQSGLSTELRQAVFSIGLRGIEKGDSSAVEALIHSTLERLRDEGIGRDILESAIKGVEFSNREIRRGGGPYSLRLLRRCLRGWIHGGAPEACLRYQPAMAEIRERLAANPRYFEDLIDLALISNRHSSVVLAYPDPDLGRRQKEALNERLSRTLSSMGGEERRRLDEGLARLKAFHESKDSPEDLARIPYVRVADIPREVERIPRRASGARDMRVISHDIFTNGICYLELAFDISAMPEGLLPWLPLYSRFVATAGLPGVPYHEMNARLASCSGGFSCILEASTPVLGERERESSRHIIFRLKSLDGDFGEAIALVRRLIGEADGSDAQRLLDVFSELKNDIQAALAPSGHSFAQTRGASGFSRSLAVEETWRGLSQHDFLSELGGAPDARAMAAKLEEIKAFLLGEAPRCASVTCDESFGAGADALVRDFAQSLPRCAPRPAAPDPLPPREGADEGFSVQTEVGYAALNLRAQRLPEPLFAPLAVLSTLISSNYLWDEIRVKRGAYGVWASVDPMEGIFSFLSYRDPAPVKSLETYRLSLEKVAAEACDPQDVEKAVVGTVSGELRPLTPEEKGFVDLRRYLFSLSDQLRQEKRERLLAVDAASLAKAARFLLDGWQWKVQTIIAGKAEIEAASHSLQRLKCRDLGC